MENTINPLTQGFSSIFLWLVKTRNVRAFSFNNFENITFATSLLNANFCFNIKYFVPLSL